MRDERLDSFALVVDDHPLVVDSLVACIRSCDVRLEINTADSLAVALRILARRPAPALIVTDLSLTDTQGSEAVAALRRAAPGTPLVVFTAHDEAALRDEAKALGAVAFLVKSASATALRNEILAVVGAAPGVQRPPPGPALPLKHLLTPKQIAVLEELTAGRSNKEIAARMNISDETVGSHMKEILSRLAVRNRTEAVIRYLDMIAPPHERHGS